MRRVKEAAADVLTAAVDGTAAGSSALTATAGRPESLETKLPLSKRARLPDPARFLLVVILSFALSSLGTTFLDYWTQNELADIARPATSRTETSILIAWELFGLALGWLGDYDGYDLAALAFLSRGPATLLLSVFYGIRAVTAGAYLAVHVASTFLPFFLLRQLSGAHSAAPGIPNREIVVDRGIQLLTALQPALVYSVVLFLASRTFLPDAMVLYFNGIPTIRPATDATMLGFSSPISQAFSLLLGLAARTFIFTPLVTTGPTPQDQKNAEFDPANATLWQTVVWNLWGYSTQTKVSLRRTAVAMLFTAVGTFLDTAMAIKGVEPYGAVVYSSIWLIAALVTGLMLRYVGGI